MNAAALALLAATVGSARPVGPAFLDHYGGGGESRSPNGRWRVWSRPPDADPAETAPAWLHGPGVRRRLLLRYERALFVTWMADGRHVVLRSQGTHLASIAVFSISRSPSRNATRPERMIEAALARTGPALARVEDREIVFGRDFPDHPCLIVREAGLPLGSGSGSYVTRTARFLLDVAAPRVTPTNHCGGADLAR